MEEKNGVISIADLRMGVEPYYTFTFDVATRARDQHHERILFVTPKQPMPDIKRDESLQWFQRRLLGQTDQSLVELLQK